MTEKSEILRAIARLESWLGLVVAQGIEGAVLTEIRKGRPEAENALAIVCLSTDRIVEAQIKVLQTTIDDEHADWLTELEWQNALALARAINN